MIWISSADEEMEVDKILLHRDVLGLVQPRYTIKLLFAWLFNMGIFF